MPKIDVLITIPLADNAGAVFTDAHHDRFHDALDALLGGYTRLAGEQAGSWRSPAGVTYRDASRVYLVGVAGLLRDGAGVLAAVEFAKAHYAQEAIFVRYLTVSETI